MPRVLGIDPGLTRLGVGVIDADARHQSLVHVTVLRTSPQTPIEHRLLQLSQGIDAALTEFSPDAIALERVFAQQNLSSVMGVAQVSGIVLMAAAAREIPIAMLTPTAVKAAVTGYGGADKAQVGEMVRRLLRLQAAPKPADAADALALAITHGRTIVRTGVVNAASGAEPTPAQKAWAAAESQARRSR